MTSRPSQNVLIHRLGSLGDTLVALPAFRLVRAAFPEARITVLTNQAQSDNAKSVGMAAILGGAGIADDYLYYPKALRDARALLHLRNEIARQRFDTIVYMSSPGSSVKKVVRDSLFFLSCGIRRQYGFACRQHGRLNAPLTGTDLYQSESARLVANLERLRPIDLSEERWWDLQLSTDEHAQARNYLAGTIDDSPFFALSVGTKAQVSDWTQPNWIAFVRALNERHAGRGLVTLGAGVEYERSQSLLDLWDGPRQNLCGKPSPRESAAILKQADMFIGHDSGPMHLAANVGTSCAVVFSARVHPGVWYPRGTHHQVIYHATECRNCRLFVCIDHNNKCILSITHHELLQAVENVLVRKASRCRSVSISPRLTAAHDCGES
jgi:heptosyltransferase-3